MDAGLPPLLCNGHKEKHLTLGMDAGLPPLLCNGHKEKHFDPRHGCRLATAALQWS
jgi:hypothetical protein